MHTPDSTPASAGPARPLILALALIGALWLLALRLVLSEPWMGVLPRAQGDHVIASGVVAGIGIPPGAQLLRIGPAGGTLTELRPSDLIEEPDFFDTYAEMADFFARQTTLREALGGDVELHWRAGEETGIARIAPVRRTAATLPHTFWFQLCCGSLATVIGLWVWLLRRDAWSARMLLLTGVSYLLFTAPAAVYSSRALAVDGELFRALSSANHFGANLFGCGLVALTLSYPRLRCRPAWIALPFAVFMPWWLADVLRLAPNQDWGSRLPIMSEMCIAIVIGVTQWFLAKGDVLARAALRWVLLSVLVGSGLFVFLMVGSQMLGSFPPLPQGYALGFFLIMFVGLALGVGRYRLFDLDRWAYYVLLWVGGAALVLALDAAMISVLHMAPPSALLSSALLVGAIYVPLRQWLLLRFTPAASAQVQPLSDVLSLALMSDPLERSNAWKRLLAERFQPMSMDEIPAGETSESRILEEGLSLETPARNGCPALRLHLRDGGQSLFSQRDLQFVESLHALLGQTLLQRSALDEATHAERQRIGEDLHDDLGSRLLMLIHRSRDEELAGIARDAMADLRSILTAIDGPGATLAETLADCRAEAAARCEAAGTELSWQQSGDIPEHRLSAQARSSLERCLRELITNALKHARPAWLAARVDVTGGRLWISLRHPWSGEGEIHKGRGLRGIERRIGSLSGRLSISIEAAGQLDARLELPL